jgi:hypothetical protein
LGIGDWGLGIGPNPQSPIPNPQSPRKNTKVCDKFDKIEVEGRNKIGVYNTLRFEDHIKIEIIKKI